MSRTARGRAMAAVAAAAAAVAVSGGPALAQGSPSVRVDRTGTAAGETIAVAGDGWADGALVLVELCGHAGLRGSVDCDVAHGQLVTVGAGGQLFAALQVGLPPVPCPCVVRAVDQTSAVVATTPIAVQGLPTVPLDSTEASPLPIRVIEVTDVGLERESVVASWFGGRARWTLTFTLRNTGTVDLRDPPLSIAIGKQEDPTGLVVPPAVGTLAPGEERAFTVPVRTEPFAFGGYTVKIEAHGFAEPVIARAHESSYPWGLAVLAVIALQALLVVARNRLRRRLAPEPAPEVLHEHEPAPALELTGPAVIDLTEPTPGPETEAEPVVVAAAAATPEAEPALEPEPVPAAATAAEPEPVVVAATTGSAPIPPALLETARELVETARLRRDRTHELVLRLRAERNAIAAGTAGTAAWAGVEPADLATRLHCLADELSEMTGLAVDALRAAIDALEESAVDSADLADAAARHHAALVEASIAQPELTSADIDLRVDANRNGGAIEVPPANDHLSQRIHEAVTRALRS